MTDGTMLFADRPNEEDLKMIRTRKADMPMLPVTLKDGSERELWCTFGPEQIDLDIASPSGKPSSLSSASSLLSFQVTLRLIAKNSSLCTSVLLPETVA